MKPFLSLLLFFTISIVSFSQKDTLGKPVYKCQAFKNDTVAKKIIFNKDYSYCVYNLNGVHVKSGWGKECRMEHIIAGHYYIYLCKNCIPKEITFEQAKEKGYLIKN